MVNLLSLSSWKVKERQAALLLLAMLTPLYGMAQSPQLITGKTITLPPLGTQQNVGSLVDNIILSPNGKYAITTDTGFNQSLWSMDASTGMLIDHIDYPNDVTSTNGLFYGLAFAGNTLYAAQGANDTIAVVSLVPNGQIFQTGTMFTPTRRFSVWTVGRFPRLSVCGQQ